MSEISIKELDIMFSLVYILRHDTTRHDTTLTHF